MRSKAFKYFLLLIFFIFLSNFIAVYFGYSFFQISSGLLDSAADVPAEPFHELTPLYLIPNIQIISNSTGLVLGFILGIMLGIYPQTHTINLLVHMQTFASNMLKFLILPLLPLLILGFAVKIQHDGVLETSASGYGRILLNFFLAQLCYIIIALVIISGFRIKNFIYILGKIVPASITGFSTFSSAATMPVTIACTEKILDDKSIAKSFIPATVNIHLVGTAIGMNVIILSCLSLYGMPIPSYLEFLPFAFYFVIMMFAVVGVPGGSIFTIAPLIEQYLGVGPEAIALITALVLLFDPIDTSFNITANAILAKFFERFYQLVDSLRIFRVKRSEVA
jgi:Na+/H+-dicarboxylate symporter